MASTTAPSSDSPRRTTQHTLETNGAPSSDDSRHYDSSIFAGGPRSLSGIALRGGSLGLALGLCISLSSYLALSEHPLWRVPFFVAILAFFHFMEFFTTARYNTPAATTDSFLLTSNGRAYNLAHSAAMIEAILCHSVFRYPSLTPEALHPVIMLVGFALLLLGQGVRSFAMATAGTNFNHIVQMQKAKGHELVTTGIYAWSRHPSYFGFFWWGVGSQIVLGNRVSLAAYAFLLWHFFSRRIKRK
jgi:protein-S-isoprenylcysteine O-methyltransferase